MGKKGIDSDLLSSEIFGGRNSDTPEVKQEEPQREVTRTAPKEKKVLKKAGRKKVLPVNGVRLQTTISEETSTLLRKAVAELGMEKGVVIDQLLSDGAKEILKI